MPKPTMAERGYGIEHKRERKRWSYRVEAGNAVCVRCGLPIYPGQKWHLDHSDDRTWYLGVSHASCNVRHANELRAARAKAYVEGAEVEPEPRRHSRVW